MKIKKTIGIWTLVMTAWSSQSHAQVERILSPEVQRCSMNIYQRIAAKESKTDHVCSLGRTDTAFQSCVINLTHELDRVNQPQGYPDGNNVLIAGEACAYTGHIEAARCATDLYLRGGLYVVDRTGIDGVKVCTSAQAYEVKRCVVDLYQSGRHTGKNAAKICLDQYDPVAIKKRQEDERRRQEQQRMEQQRIEQQRQQDLRQAEARRQQEIRAAEQRRIEEQRRQAEQKKTENKNQTQYPEPVQVVGLGKEPQVEVRELPPVSSGTPKETTAPKSSSQESKNQDKDKDKKSDKKPADDDGVILDLPNFD